MDVALMLASITCLKPFLKPFDGAVFVSTARSKGLGYGASAKSSRADAYYELSAASQARSRIDKKQEVVVETRDIADMEDDRDDQDLIQPCARPKQAFRPGTIVSAEGGYTPADREHPYHISKTDPYTVSYDQ